MSAQATFWAWKQELNGRSKLVLLYLANCHNQDTGDCFPSASHVAKITGLNVKTVFTSLGELERLELIKRDGKAGSSNRYALNLQVTHTENGSPTHTENGIPTYTENGSPPIPKTGQTYTETGSLTYKEPKSKKTPAETYCEIPDDFGISDQVKQWAAENNFDRLDDRLEHFINYAISSGKKYKGRRGWDAAFRNAIKGDWAKLGKAVARAEEYF